MPIAQLSKQNAFFKDLLFTKTTRNNNIYHVLNGIPLIIERVLYLSKLYFQDANVRNIEISPH